MKQTRMNKTALEDRSKKYWTRIRSIGISRQRGEDRGLLAYLNRIIEKKNLLADETLKNIYRELGNQYAKIDSKEDAWRYWVMADGHKKAKQAMQAWKDKWSQTYRRAFEDYRGY